MGFLVSISTVGINSKSFSGLYTPYKKPPRPTRVDNTADNADITQSQAAIHQSRDPLTWFEPNTVLWVFHTTQPSSCVYFVLCYILLSMHVCCCCVRFRFFSTKPRDKIGWEEHLRNDVFCVELNIKTLTQSVNTDLVS